MDLEVGCVASETAGYVWPVEVMSMKLRPSCGGRVSLGPGTCFGGWPYSSQGPFLILSNPSCLPGLQLYQELLLQNWDLIFESNLLKLRDDRSCHGGDGQHQRTRMLHNERSRCTRSEGNNLV